MVQVEVQTPFMRCQEPSFRDRLDADVHQKGLDDSRGREGVKRSPVASFSLALDQSGGNKKRLESALHPLLSKNGDNAGYLETRSVSFEVLVESNHVVLDTRSSAF